MSSPHPPSFRQGKVRDIYDWGDQLVLVATDRISAFDWVLPTVIPDKGRVLTQLSRFWFDLLHEPHHQIAAPVDVLAMVKWGDAKKIKEVRIPDGAPDGDLSDWLAGRTTLARKCQPALVECVVRGYLVGSGWKDYQNTGQVCGITLPAGLLQCARLPEPIFTPATKAQSDVAADGPGGHDENISFEQMINMVGPAAAEELRRRSMDCYLRGAEHAQSCGVIIADTKFEWGLCDGEWLLIDEVLTPDSSRFWPADDYQPGRNQVSFDKQFVRQWLEETRWDKQSPPPSLPADVVRKTREKYIEAFERLTGETFPWA